MKLIDLELDSMNDLQLIVVLPSCTAPHPASCQDSETFASVLQILRFHRIFGTGAPGTAPGSTRDSLWRHAGDQLGPTMT